MRSWDSKLAIALSIRALWLIESMIEIVDAFGKKWEPRGNGIITPSLTGAYPPNSGKQRNMARSSNSEPVPYIVASWTTLQIPLSRTIENENTQDGKHWLSLMHCHT